MLRAAGLSVVNADLTVIAQAPQARPAPRRHAGAHRAAARGGADAGSTSRPPPPRAWASSAAPRALLPRRSCSSKTAHRERRAERARGRAHAAARARGAAGAAPRCAPSPRTSSSRRTWASHRPAKGQHLLLQGPQAQRQHRLGGRANWRAWPAAAQHDVGYAGLKDRRAVARCSGSRCRGRARRWNWRRCAARASRFWRCSRTTASCRAGRWPATASPSACAPWPAAARSWPAALAERLAVISRAGVPNYFGPQRFGRDGANLERMAVPDALAAARPSAASCSRPRAASSSMRCWRSACSDGHLGAGARRGSCQPRRPRQLFRGATSADAVLDERARALNIHPTGPLWGEGSPATAGRGARARGAHRRALCAGGGAVCRRGHGTGAPQPAPGGARACCRRGAGGRGA